MKEIILPMHFYLQGDVTHLVLVMHLCGILHDTHSVLYQLHRWDKPEVQPNLPDPQKESPNQADSLEMVNIRNVT
jgi:hypothetical protein